MCWRIKDLLSRQELQHGRWSNGHKRLPADGVELAFVDSWQLNTEPTAMTDVRRSEEALRIGLDHLRLNSVGCGAPDREPSVVVMIVEKHHEALLVTDEERGPTMTRTFRGLRQCQARAAHLAERLIDLMLRKPAHSD